MAAISFSVEGIEFTGFYGPVGLIEDISEIYDGKLLHGVRFLINEPIQNPVAPLYLPAQLANFAGRLKWYPLHYERYYPLEGLKPHLDVIKDWKLHKKSEKVLFKGDITGILNPQRNAYYEAQLEDLRVQNQLYSDALTQTRQELYRVVTDWQRHADRIVGPEADRLSRLAEIIQMVGKTSDSVGKKTLKKSIRDVMRLEKGKRPGELELPPGYEPSTWDKLRGFVSSPEQNQQQENEPIEQ